MAQVTVELRHLLQSYDFQLFDFDYELDDKNYKEELEQAIIDYYFFYEIGQETPDRFKHKFKTRFKRIIGYYNKLYNTTLLEYNPLINSKISEALDQLATTANIQDVDNSTTSNGTTVSDTLTNIDQTTAEDTTRTDNLTTTTNTNTKDSDYPQQNISGGDYLAGEQENTTDTTNTGTVGQEGSNTTTATNTSGTTTTSEDTIISNGKTTNNGTNNTNYSKTIEGLTGTSYQELIQKERENILRITSMIIEELKPCFILVH